jgi:hypothetical protein
VHFEDKTSYDGFGSSAFGYCSYSTINLAPAQPSDRDLMTQI